MTRDELKTMCEKALQPTSMNFSKPCITIKMPENKHCPKTRKMFGQVMNPARKSPVGQVVAWGFDGYDTVIFDAQEVLDYINSLEAE